MAGVEGIPRAVAHEVKGEDAGEDGEAGEAADLLLLVDDAAWRRGAWDVRVARGAGGVATGVVAIIRTRVSFSPYEHLVNECLSC